MCKPCLRWAPANNVELRTITTAERVGEDWIVQQGLKPGDRVIVEGQLKVRAGHARDAHSVSFRVRSPRQQR